MNLLKKDKSITVNGITYQKIELIGKGGSSKVYKIMNEQGKIFALKKVKLAEQDDIVVEGYMNEVSLLKRLVKNERIIQLVDSESRIEDGVLLMVLEYGEIDLAHLLVKEKTGGLSPNFIRMYWEQMLRAVHAIHEEQIIHSDLKPAVCVEEGVGAGWFDVKDNFYRSTFSRLLLLLPVQNFMLVEGALKLIDFGIAKSIPNDTTNIHREHQTGTINYMSPEALTFVDSVSEDDKVLKVKKKVEWLRRFHLLPHSLFF